MECVKILAERGAQASTQNMVSSSRPVRSLLVICVLVIYVDCESDL